MAASPTVKQSGYQSEFADTPVPAIPDRPYIHGDSLLPGAAASTVDPGELTEAADRSAAGHRGLRRVHGNTFEIGEDGAQCGGGMTPIHPFDSAPPVEHHRLRLGHQIDQSINVLRLPQK